MTALIFLRAGKLCKRELQIRYEKQRIVAEPAAAAGGARDQAGGQARAAAQT
jgi:hypothetical protein